MSGSKLTPLLMQDNYFCRYPGGRWFDPFGLSRGDAKKLDEYKTKEIKNGRLAILVGASALHVPDRCHSFLRLS